MTYLGYYCSKESPGTNSLLDWIREKIPHRNINNFTSDWKDGVALACLTDVVSGGQFPDYEDMTQEDPLENASKSMAFAETLGVPKTMTSEDFIDPSVDPLPLMTYLTYFKNVVPSNDPLTSISAAGPGISGDKAQKETNFVIRGRIPDWAPLDVTITAPDGSKIDHQKLKTVATSSAVKYTPTIPGTYVIDVKVNNEHIKGSPFTAHHKEPSNAKNCTASFSDLEKALVGKTSEIIVDCTSGGTGSLQVEVTGPNGRIGTDIKEKSDRVYAVTMTPSEAGPHVVAMNWSGTHISGSPFTVNAVDPKKCNITGPGLTNAEVNQPAIINVQTTDAGQGVLDVIVTGPNNDPIPVKMREDSPGKHVTSFVPTQKGNHSVQVKWAGYPVGTPLNVAVIAPLDPSKCKVKDVPTGYIRAGKEAKFIVDTTEAGDAAVSASGKGVSLPQQCIVRPLESGINEVSFTPFEVGNLDIRALFGDNEIPNMPLSFNVNDPTKCNVNSAAIEKGSYSVKEPISFRVSAQYAGEGKISAELHGPAGSKEPEVKEVGDGTYQVQFEPIAPGPHGISIFFDGEQIPNGLVRLFVEAGSGSDDVIITQPAPTKLGVFLVDSCYDYKVNASGAKKGELAATGNGIRTGNKPKINITDNGDGQYLVGVTTDTPDEYHVTITWGGDAVPGSPFVISTVNAANANKVKIDGPHYELGKLPVSLIADTSDAGAGEITAHCHGKREGSIPVDIKETDSKTFDIGFDSPKFDAYTLSVLFSQEHVPGSPFKIANTPPDASKVVVIPTDNAASPFIIKTPNAGVGKLTATCKGRKVNEVPVTIMETEPDVYAVNFDSPPRPDIYTVDMKWADEDVPGSPFELNQYPLDASKVKVNKPTSYSGPAVQFTADASEAGVGKLTATCNGKKNGKVSTTVSEIEPYKYAVDVNGLDDDVYTFGMKYSDVDVPDFPYTVNRLPTDADKVIVVPPVENTAGVFKIDASQAGVGELSSTCVGKKVGSVPISVNKIDDDKYEVDFNPSRPDIYTVGVLFSGNNVPGSPFEMNLYPTDASKVRVTKPRSYSVPKAHFDVDASEAGIGELTAKCIGKNTGPATVQVKPTSPYHYDMDIDNLKPDFYTIDILYDDKSVPDSPFSINLIPTDADKVIVVPPVGQAAAGVFKIDTSQAGVGELSSTCVGKKVGSVPISVNKIDDDKYEVDFNPSRPDIYTVGVLFSGNNVPGSPFEMNLYPTDASKVRVTKPRSYSVPKAHFDVDASEAGIGELTAKCIGKNTGPATVQVKPTSPYHYDMDIDNLKPDFYTINILYDDKSVPDSPFSINLLPTDASKVIVTPPDSYAVSVRAPFKVDAREAGDGELTALCSAENTTNLPVDIAQIINDEHLYKVSVIPIKEDKYHLSILWNKRDIPGSPFELNLIPPTFADRVTVSEPVFKSVNEPVEASVDTTRAGPGQLTAKCEGKDCGNVNVDIKETEKGKHTLSFTPTKPDDYNLSIFYNDTPIPRSPLLIAAKPISEDCNFVIEEDVENVLEFDMSAFPPQTDQPLEKTPAELELDIGDPLTIDISIPEEEEKVLAATAVGDRVGPAKVTVNKVDGSFNVEFNPNKPDRYVISITYDDAPAPNSPIIVNYRSKYDASKCVVFGLDKVPFHPMINIPIMFGVDAIKAGKGDLRVTTDGPSAEEPSTIKVAEDTNDKGIYHITYLPTASGDHNIHLQWVDEPVTGSPLMFMVVSGSAITGEKTYVFGKPAVLNVTAECKAKQLDAHAVQEGTNIHTKLKVSKGPSKGVYNLSFQPNTPGFYHVFVKLNGNNVAGSPYRMQYADPPDPSKVKVNIDHPDVGYVNEPITFTIDTTDAGTSDLVLRTNIRKKARDKRKAPDFKVSDSIDGIHTAKFVPIHPAQHQFEIVYAGEHVPGSPFSVLVKQKPPSISHILSSNLNLILVGKPVDVYFTLDGDDTPESISATVNGNHTDNAEIKVQSLEGDCEYRAHFVPTNPDDYQIEVFHAKRHIDGSPFPVKVIGLGGFEQTKSPADIENPPIAPAGKPFNLLLPMEYDRKRSIVANIDGPDLIGQPVEVRDDKKGNYGVLYTPQKPGDYLVNVKDDDNNINGSPFRILVKESRSDATKCHIVEEDKPIFTKTQKFGKPVNFRISTIEAGPGTLNITSRGPGKADVRIFDNSNGSYTCEFTPSVAGKYNVDILWDDQHITDSPYELNFREKKKKVITGLDLDLNNFRVGVPHRFKLHCEEIGTGSLELNVKPPTAAETTVSRMGTDSYQVQILPVEEGHHELSVLYGGTHIFGSPYTVTFNTKGDAAKCRMLSSDVEQMDDGHDHVVFIVSIEGAGKGKLVAHVDNPQSGERQPVTIDEIEPMTYKVHFDLGEGTEYQLVIKYDGEHIEGSPFKLLFADEVDASICRAEGDGLRTALVDKETSFVIYTEGAGEGEVTVSIKADDGLEIGTQMTKENESEYHVKYTPTRAGKYTIATKFADEDITNSPFDMKCFMPLHSSNLFVVDPLSEAYLGSPLQFNVKISEEMNEEGELEIRAKSRKIEVTGKTEKKGDGYLCSIEPNVPGRYEVKILLNGENITGSPFKIKVTDPPKPENVVVYGPGIGDGCVGQEGNFTIETEEAGTGTMSVRVHGPKGAFKIHMRRHPENERTILVRYDPKYAGQYKIDVTWSDVHVPGSPFTVDVHKQENILAEVIENGTEEDKS